MSNAALSDDSLKSAIPNLTGLSIILAAMPWCSMTPDAINTVIDFDHPDIQNTILVNADEDLAFCDAFRVRGTPAILFVKDGEVVRHETGSPSPEQLLSIVEEYK